MAVFSFEERFKAFIGHKIIDNMELLQEKRQAEYNSKVMAMCYEDVDEEFTNAEFRSFLDNSNHDNMLEDLVQQFVHKAIELGAKEYADKQK